MTKQLPISIYGAGPAGSALAFLLARRGVEVCLHAWPHVRALDAETLIPASATLIQRLGLGTTLDAFMEAKPLRHGINWSGEWTWREGDYASPRVARSVFDRALLDTAVAVGAQVVHDTGPPSKADVHGGELIVMATGSMTSSRGWVFSHEADSLAPTVALVAVLGPHRTFDDTPAVSGPTVEIGTSFDAQRNEPHRGEAGASMIEAVPEGWWWWLPLGDGSTMCVLVADADEVNRVGAGVVWDAGRRHAEGPCRKAPPAPTAGRVATSWRRTSDEVFLAGDAACRLDPLSSQGIEKALASAEQLAAALLRARTHPDEQTCIRDYMRRWDAGLFLAHARKSLAFYAAETRFTGAPFWSRRHDLAQRSLGQAKPMTLTGLIRKSGRARSISTYRFADGDLVPQIAWITDEGGPAVAELGGVPVEHWFALVESPCTVVDAVARAAERPTFIAHSPAGVARQLAELVRLGFLAEG